MQRIALNQLSEPVQEFLARVQKGQGLVVEDESGRARCGVIPFVEVTPEERRAAWERLQRIQEKVGQSLAEQGVTEDDVIRAVLADD